jgi:glutaredoxin
MLNIKKIAFTEHKLTVDFSREELLENFPNAKTFPVIVVNDRFIGGYDDMVKMLEEQKEDFGKDLLKE